MSLLMSKTIDKYLGKKVAEDAIGGFIGATMESFYTDVSRERNRAASLVRESINKIDTVISESGSYLRSISSDKNVDKKELEEARLTMKKIETVKSNLETIVRGI